MNARQLEDSQNRKHEYQHVEKINSGVKSDSGSARDNQ